MKRAFLASIGFGFALAGQALAAPYVPSVADTIIVKAGGVQNQEINAYSFVQQLTGVAPNGLNITSAGASASIPCGPAYICLSGTSGPASGLYDHTAFSVGGYTSLLLNPIDTAPGNNGILGIYVNPVYSGVGTIGGISGIYSDPYQNTVGAVQTLVEAIDAEADIDNGTYTTENLFAAYLVSAGGSIGTLNDFYDAADVGSATPVTTHHGFYQPAPNHPNVFASHFGFNLGPNIPVISACGTTPSTVTGSDTAGHFSIGTGSPTSCTITFHVAYLIAPECGVWDSTVTSHLTAWSVNTTVLTLTITGTGGDTIGFHCFG